MVKKLLPFFIIFFSLFNVENAFAAKTKTKKKTKKKIKIERTLSSFAIYQSIDPQLAGLNQSNRILKTPSESLLFELRPEWTIKFKRQAELHLKPFLNIQGSRLKFQSPSETQTESEGTIDFREAFVEALNFSSLRLRAGLLNYEWGPSELVAPSNALYHFAQDQPFSFFQRKGYVLLDLIYNFSDSSNIQLLQEGLSNKEPNWIHDVDFQARTLVKFEHSFENSLNYFGLTAGRAERQRTFEGFYFNYTPIEGYSLYFDGRVTHGSLGYHPQSRGFGQYQMTLLNDPHKEYAFYLFGLRYESDFDLRLEWLHFDEGYDEAEYDHWLQSLQLFQFYSKANWSHSERNGLEFLTKNYQLVSLRIPDFGWNNQMSFYLRALMSPIKSGTLLMTSLDSPVGDSGALSLSFVKGLGDENSEFVLIDKGRWVLTFQWTYY